MKKFLALLSSAWVFLLLSPAAFADTGIGDAAATEVRLLIPQATVVGLAVTAVVGIIIAIVVVIQMMKRI